MDRRHYYAIGAGLLSLALWCSSAEAQLVHKFAADQTGAGQYAVNLARRALDAYCLRREVLATPADLPPLLRLRGGVFVSTMRADGAPRCCMGCLYPRGANLASDIVEIAQLAAAHDLRFKPLKPRELTGLRVIVSILDPPQPITDPFQLDPVADGLAVRAAARTGVVLPGETGRLASFVSWGRTRANASALEPVEYFKLQAIRFIEPHPPSGCKEAADGLP